MKPFPFIKPLHNSVLLMLVALALLAGVSAAQAQTNTVHKVVIQVSRADPAEHTIALNMASNLQKLYGMDNVKIEIVAFGQGLEILTPKSAEAARVKSMVLQDVRFSACANTMDKIEKKTGKRPELTEGVQIVPAGVGRIIELQEQRYAYAAP